MPNWFYIDATGQKQGPVNDAQLKELVAQEIIRPDTPLKTETGQMGKASQIRGLFPEPAQPQPAPEAVPPAPSAVANPTASSKSTIDVIIDGTAKTLTKQEFTDLAAQGTINPNTPIRVNGKLGKAGQVKGTTFGQPLPVPTSSNPTSSEQPLFDQQLFGQQWNPVEFATAPVSSVSAVSTPAVPGFDRPPPTRVQNYQAAQYDEGGHTGSERFIPAVIVGAVAAVACALLWGGISAAIGGQIGWMAVGVGAVVGVSVRFAGNGNTAKFGLLGAGFSVLAIIIGNLFMVAVVAANSQEINPDGLSAITILFNVLLSPALVFEIMKEIFAPVDIIFYALAIYFGFKTAFANDPFE
jgi:hypothetical protein